MVSTLYQVESVKFLVEILYSLWTKFLYCSVQPLLFYIVIMQQAVFWFWLLYNELWETFYITGCDLQFTAQYIKNIELEYCLVGVEFIVYIVHNKI